MKTAELKKTVEELEAYVEELEETLVYVREVPGPVVKAYIKDLEDEVMYLKEGGATLVGNKSGRMQQVLDVLNKYGHVSVPRIASEVGIDPRNVSSQLSYLRAGKLNGVKYAIATDSRGYKFIER